jgi:PadR family transcriptional regulator PadR
MRRIALSHGQDGAGTPRQTQLLRGVLDLCLLSLIAERPRYGYELIEGLAESGLGLVGEGSIYPLLARLERTGLVDTYRAPSTNGPLRKYYRITDAGHAELTQGCDTWVHFAAAISPLLQQRRPHDDQDARTDPVHL